MVVVCQQANYFPWLGYFEQCARADAFIVLDDVQWIKRGWQHRARVASHPSNPGDFQWLTLPVRGRRHREKRFRDLELDSTQPWAERQWKTLQSLYGKAPFFKTQLEPILAPWFGQAKSISNTLIETTWSSVEICLAALELRPKIFLSSELCPAASQLKHSSSERLALFCQRLGSDIYYSGLGSSRYLDLSVFREAGIRVLWQHWRHPLYVQHPPKQRFKSHLSILDAFANAPLSEIKKWVAASANQHGSSEKHL